METEVDKFDLKREEKPQRYEDKKDLRLLNRFITRKATLSPADYKLKNNCKS